MRVATPGHISVFCRDAHPPPDPLLTLIVLLAACDKHAKDKKEIQLPKGAYRDAAKNGDGATAAGLMSKRHTDFYARLVKLAPDATSSPNGPQAHRDGAGRRSPRALHPQRARESQRRGLYRPVHQGRPLGYLRLHVAAQKHRRRRRRARRQRPPSAIPMPRATTGNASWSEHTTGAPAA